MFGALAPRNNTVLSGLILGDTLYDRVQMRHFMQVSVNIGPASRTAQSNRAAVRAVRQARYVAQRDTSRQRLAGQLLQQLPAGSHGVCVIRLAATTFGANKNFNAALCQGSGASGVYRNGIRCRSLYSGIERRRDGGDHKGRTRHQNTPSSSRLISWQVSRLADLRALALVVTHPSRQ